MSHIGGVRRKTMAGVQPNEYTLTGGGITFTYSTTSFLGQPFASFKQGTENKSYSGSAIRVVDVGIGTLVSVTTFTTIDTGATEFSVLLPFIELADATKTQAFSTDGIVTNFKGPDSFPLTGVRESYNFIPMTGIARDLKFLLPIGVGVKKAG
jgi:hypothetical protein